MGKCVIERPRHGSRTALSAKARRYGKIIQYDDGPRRFLESRLEDESFGTSSEDVGEALGKMSLGFAAPLERTINTGGDLDLLRFEFLATGHREPIIRIIDVLEWPDRIRSLLETWLKLKNPSGFERRAAIQTLWIAEASSAMKKQMSWSARRTSIYTARWKA